MAIMIRNLKKRVSLDDAPVLIRYKNGTLGVGIVADWGYKSLGKKTVRLSTQAPAIDPTAVEWVDSFPEALAVLPQFPKPQGRSLFSDFARAVLSDHYRERGRQNRGQNSIKRARAARANGKRGGRPRKYPLLIDAAKTEVKS